MVHQVTVQFSEFGVDLAWSMTYHKIQGVTLRKILLDLNKPPFGVKNLDFYGFLVGLSRVREGKYIRILPLQPFSNLDHLRKLGPSKELVVWLKGFDVDGKWDPDLAKAADHKISAQWKAAAVLPTAKQTHDRPPADSECGALPVAKKPRRRGQATEAIKVDSPSSAPRRQAPTTALGPPTKKPRPAPSPTRSLSSMLNPRARVPHITASDCIPEVTRVLLNSFGIMHERALELLFVTTPLINSLCDNTNLLAQLNTAEFKESTWHAGLMDNSCLKGLLNGWLDHYVIGHFFELIERASDNVVCLNPMHTKYMPGGCYSAGYGVRRCREWSQRLGGRHLDKRLKVIMSAHVPGHFIFVAVDHFARTITICDPLGSLNAQSHKDVAEFIIECLASS